MLYVYWYAHPLMKPIGPLVIFWCCDKIFSLPECGLQDQPHPVYSRRLCVAWGLLHLRGWCRACPEAGLLTTSWCTRPKAMCGVGLHVCKGKDAGPGCKTFNVSTVCGRGWLPFGSWRHSLAAGEVLWLTSRYARSKAVCSGCWLYVW